MEQPPDSLTASQLQLEATRRAMWRWVGGMVGFLAVAAMVGGLLFKVPYVALVPGTAKDTEPLVSAEGIEFHPSEGELLFTTVRVRQRPNLWEYLWLQADDDTQLLPEELVLEGRSPDENRQFNLELMNSSKSVAIAVALEELGYDAVASTGVVVASVVKDEAADGTLVPGDTMVAIDGAQLRTTQDLLDVLARYAPGDEIAIEVESFVHTAPAGADDGDSDDGDSAEEGVAAESRTVLLELGAKPDDPDAAFLGVGPTDRVEIEDDFGFEVDIDSGSVGGPSAGLAFTLAVLDHLTEGELTGGTTVAVTGTIDALGRVGPVGGVLQKTAAVRDLGADVFIVPNALGEAELARIIDRAGDDLEIIPVDNLDEALAALATLGGDIEAVEEFAAGNLS